MTITSSQGPVLLAIVEVSPEEKVRCGQPGCGHSIWKAIHVVLDTGKLLVLGSTCFAKHYGSGVALGSPRYGGGDGRKLTSDERQLLVENTAAFIAGIEEEMRRRADELARAESEANAEAARRARQLQNLARRPVPASSIGPASWPWMKPGASFNYLKLRDGTAWVRVLRRDGRHALVPWPRFDGWDEALPAALGLADKEAGSYVLANVQAAIAYLQGLGEPCRVFGSWRDLVKGIRGP